MRFSGKHETSVTGYGTGAAVATCKACTSGVSGGRDTELSPVQHTAGIAQAEQLSR